MKKQEENYIDGNFEENHCYKESRMKNYVLLVCFTISLRVIDEQFVYHINSYSVNQVRRPVPPQPGHNSDLISDNKKL